MMPMKKFGAFILLAGVFFLFVFPVMVSGMVFFHCANAFSTPKAIRLPVSRQSLLERGHRKCGMEFGRWTS